MDYQIVIKPNYTDSVKVGIITEPDNEPSKFVLSGVGLKNLATFLSCVYNAESYGQEHISVQFFNNMDWEDKAWAGMVKGYVIEEGDVLLWHSVFGDSVLKEDLFRNIVQDYTEMILRVYQDDPSLSKEWLVNISNLLNNLASK